MTVQYISRNPYNDKFYKEYPLLSTEELNERLAQTRMAYNKWKNVSISERASKVRSLKQNLKDDKTELSVLVSKEMGKPIKQAKAEIDKCAMLCDYYAQNAASFLEPEKIELDGQESSVRFDPLGAIYGIMPWNFPFWQVFRFAVPTLLAGNTVILKHAPNVPQCAEAIEKLFEQSGMGDFVFQNVYIDYEQSDWLIEHPLVQGVSLTGSTLAGSKVASKAAQEIKTTVLELGGSDPFIVLEDADMSQAIKTAVKARMQNTGQSCIAAKRFIIHEKVFKKFKSGFLEHLSQMKMGDPLNEETDLGTMARPDLKEQLSKQVKDAIDKGATFEDAGHEANGANFHKPGILHDLDQTMKAYHEEVFGPVALFFKVKDSDEALSLANESDYGLGGVIWTENSELANSMAGNLNTGTVAINGMVKSHPAIPFGGVKKSGYGRELSKMGIREFVNAKTVNIFK